MHVDAYLERIGYHGPLSPTAETLRRLHVAHLLSVPFENLSIHWKEPIQLDDEALFEKVVTRRRGGFCYELNGLFAALLRALGFEVTMLSAGVYGAAGNFSPDYDHMALLVTLEDRWLADVGFGDSFREPLRLGERSEQVEGDLAYRIEETADGRLLLARREEDGPWKTQFRFSLAARLRRLRRPVPLPPDLAPIPFHPESHLLPGDAGRTRDAERDEADHDPRRREAGAGAGGPGVRGGAPGPLRDRIARLIGARRSGQRRP